MTTIEGIIDRSVAGLEQDQNDRRKENPEVAAQIEEFIEKLKALKKLEKPFTLVCIMPGSDYAIHCATNHGDKIAATLLPSLVNSCQTNW